MLRRTVDLARTGHADTPRRPRRVWQAIVDELDELDERNQPAVGPGRTPAAAGRRSAAGTAGSGARGTGGQAAARRRSPRCRAATAPGPVPMAGRRGGRRDCGRGLAAGLAIGFTVAAPATPPGHAAGPAAAGRAGSIRRAIGTVGAAYARDGAASW